MDTFNKIRVSIRGILTGLWLDASQIRISYSAGAVRLTGTLQRIPGAGGSEVRPQLIDALASEIRRLKGVKRVYMDFTNWARAGGRWVPGRG